MKSKAYKDTAFNVADYLSTLVIYLITTKLLIAQLGTDGYGFYMFFTSLIGTFGLVDLGMGMAVSKYLSQYIHHNEFAKGMQVITQAVIFYSIAGSLLTAFVIIFSDQLLVLFNFDKKFYSAGKNVILAATAIFSFNLFISIGNNVLVAFEHWQKISILSILFKILSACILINVVLSNLDYNNKLSYIFYALMLISLLKLIVYTGAALKIYPYFSFNKPSLDTKSLMNNFLKWSSLQYGLSMAVGHVDKIIISRYFGMDTLGLYSFVVNAILYLFGFVTSAFRIFYPKLSKMHSDKDCINLNLYLKRLIFGAIALSLTVSLISVILWMPLVAWYINPEFAENSYLYFIIFSLYLVVRAPEIIFSYFFNAIARPDALVRNVIVGASATIVGYFIFLPLFDSYGLIFAQIIGSISIYTYLLWLIRAKGLNYFTNLSRH